MNKFNSCSKETNLIHVREKQTWFMFERNKFNSCSKETHLIHVQKKHICNMPKEAKNKNLK